MTNTRSAARNSLYRDVRGPEQGFRIAVSASRNESDWVYCATGGPDLDRLSKPPDHGIFLGDLTPFPISVPYKTTVNDAWGVRSCLIGGRTCSTFVTVHPPGEFAWPVPPHAFQFATVLARVDIVQAFHASWSYQFLIDDNVVFKSPPLSERRNGIPLVLDIPPGARRLTVITDPLGDNQSDHAILAWPYFRVRPVLELLACIPDDAIFLGDLAFTKHHFGGLEFRIHKDAADSDALPIAGKPCTTFLDVHAPASITYEIPDGAHRFTAIGSRRDRDFTVQGTWKYEVWIDDVRVFDSAPLHEKPEGIPIDVAIPEEARELTIKVDDFGDNYQDWSILAYPCFHLDESAESVARRIGLKPGEVAFRTSEGRWLCAMDREDRLIVVDNPLEPGVRLRWRWRNPSECLFALSLTGERFVRVASSGRVHLADPPDIQNEYLTLVHADAGRYAIRAFGPYLTTHDGVVTAANTSIGPDESLEIVDPKYPPPPRPAVIDLEALAKEAVLYLNLDEIREVAEKGGQVLADASGEKKTHVIFHNALIQNGRAKKALVFNGIDAGLELKLAGPLTGSSLTIAFWIYYESYVRNANQAFWFSQAEAGRETISLCTSWGRLAWRSKNTEVALSRGEFQLRKWHHVAIVVEGTRNRLYVDGFAQMDGSCRPSPKSKSSLWFGCSASGEPETFCNGMLEDLLIINRALSAKEVRSIALS